MEQTLLLEFHCNSCPQFDFNLGYSQDYFCKKIKGHREIETRRHQADVSFVAEPRIQFNREVYFASC